MIHNQHRSKTLYSIFKLASCVNVPSPARFLQGISLPLKAGKSTCIDHIISQQGYFEHRLEQSWS